MTNLETLTNDELRFEYRKETDGVVDGRWTRDTLIKKIEDLRAKRLEREAINAAAEAERAAARKVREDRIAARGGIETFISSRSDDEDETSLRWALRKAVTLIDGEEAELAKFADAMRQDPIYALSWGISQFKWAAELKVAKELKSWFERGGTYKGWVEYATTEALRGARSPGRSTSSTSNLMDECLTEAWASAVSRY